MYEDSSLDTNKYELVNYKIILYKDRDLMFCIVNQILAVN